MNVITKPRNLKVLYVARFSLCDNRFRCRVGLVRAVASTASWMTRPAAHHQIRSGRACGAAGTYLLVPSGNSF